MDTAALVSGVASIVAVGIYVFLGWRLAQRPVSPESRLPARQFAIFWLGLAFVTAIGGIESLIAVATVPPLALVLALLYAELPLLCLVLWGLVGYLIFLFSGRTFVVPLTVAYAAMGAFLVALIALAQPDGVTIMQGAVGVHTATTFSAPYVILLVVGLILPEIVGAILYFTLAFRTKDATVRYRITLVSWSLIAWFGLGLLNLGTLLGGGLAAQVFARSLGVFAALVILLAYYPPAWIRTRLGVAGLGTAFPPAG
ncbi:MAG: hypothetical protein L3K15_08565 [Thermoplasmata archaeon]|nr:hypothetical protein [Thermoplasmata archaeon]